MPMIVPNLSKLMQAMVLTIFFSFTSQLFAQSTGKLVGCYWSDNAGAEMFTCLDLASRSFADIDTIHSIQSIYQGETSFDSANSRFIIHTNLGITIINAQTGSIIDTIANPLHLKGLEYSPSSNKIIGTYWTGSGEVFASMDIASKILTNIDTLYGVQFLAMGESAYDAINNRYFNITNLGITIVNAQTGSIIDTIQNTINMKGIEYNPNSNRLVGSYWNGSEEIFTSLDIANRTFNDIDTLNGVQYLTQGESTFDVVNNRYINHTNLGYTIINSETGAIIDTISTSYLNTILEYNPNAITPCYNNIRITPINNFIQIGNSAVFQAASSNSNEQYIWQSDFGQGFVNLNDYGDYSGVNTNSLSITNVQLRNHTQKIRAISTSGNCIDTSNIAQIFITDTCLSIVYDTVHISTTDTLIIIINVPGVNPPSNLNKLKLYPNPAKTYITIDYGNYTSITDYRLLIINSFGQIVHSSLVNQQMSYINLSTWTGNGIYYVQLKDAQNNTLETRSILIQ